MDRGAWWATVHGVAKSWAWVRGETTMTTYEVYNNKTVKE